MAENLGHSESDLFIAQVVFNVFQHPGGVGPGPFQKIRKLVDQPGSDFSTISLTIGLRVGFLI